MRFSSVGGFFELNAFPGCNQIVVSNHAFIYKDCRGKGFGKLQHEIRLNTAFNDLGYDYIICTVHADNKAEKHILATHGWKKLDGFTSTQTERAVEIWGRKLGELTETEIKGH